MIENKLIETFFDDKLDLSFDIKIFFKDGSSKDYKLSIVFKEKITDFMFDKLLSYIYLDISENEKNYNKVKEYLAKIIDKVVVDGENETQYTTLQTTVYYLQLIVEKIKEQLADLKKK